MIICYWRKKTFIHAFTDNFVSPSLKGSANFQFYDPDSIRISGSTLPTPASLRMTLFQILKTKLIKNTVIVVIQANDNTQTQHRISCWRTTASNKLCQKGFRLNCLKFDSNVFHNSHTAWIRSRMTVLKSLMHPANTAIQISLSIKQM